MAKEFVALDANDTRERRKELGLPIFKPLRYMKRTNTGGWREVFVSSYRIVNTYQPSGLCSFILSLDNGEEVQILQDYFIEMQKPSFVDDMNKQEE